MILLDKSKGKTTNAYQTQARHSLVWYGSVGSHVCSINSVRSSARTFLLYESIDSKSRRPEEQQHSARRACQTLYAMRP